MVNNVQLAHQDHQASGLRFPLVLLAHDIEVHLNIGSLFRIADALGLEKICLSGKSPVPPNPKIRRTSRSCEQFVAFEYASDPMDFVQHYRAAAYRIISLEISSQSRDLSDFRLAPDSKVCLILGAENTGVSQTLLDASDEALHIAMRGQNSSMNVANACAIACYQIVQQLNLETAVGHVAHSPNG